MPIFCASTQEAHHFSNLAKRLYNHVLCLYSIQPNYGNEEVKANHMRSSRTMQIGVGNMRGIFRRSWSDVASRVPDQHCKMPLQVFGAHKMDIIWLCSAGYVGVY